MLNFLLLVSTFYQYQISLYKVHMIFGDYDEGFEPAGLLHRCWDAFNSPLFMFSLAFHTSAPPFFKVFHSKLHYID